MMHYELINSSDPYTFLAAIKEMIQGVAMAEKRETFLVESEGKA